MEANPINQMLGAARSRAKRYSLPFNITKNDITIPEFCPVLGIRLRKAEDKLAMLPQR
jgi:hypothetical protein